MFKVKNKDTRTTLMDRPITNFDNNDDVNVIAGELWQTK